MCQDREGIFWKIGAYCSLQNWHLRRSEKEQTQERFSSFIESILKKKSNQEKIWPLPDRPQEKQKQPSWYLWILHWVFAWLLHCPRCQHQSIEQSAKACESIANTAGDAWYPLYLYSLLFFISIEAYLKMQKC